MYTGLSSQKAEELLRQNGFNEIPEKKISIFTKIIKNLLSPISIMLLIASVFSFFLAKIFDGYFILVLLILNIGITLWQESKADNAIRKLNENLEQKIKTFRDGKWQHVSSRNLVVGDVIQLALGEVIPADGKILETQHASINESTLTGESLPKDKKEEDAIFSGSYVATGIVVIEITQTGIHTKFGQTIFAVEKIIKRSALEKDIISISKFLTILSFAAVAVLTVIFIAKKAPILELLTLDLSLIIAGIPVSLPTVMTLIIEFGVLNLAKKNVIVRRLSALEDLANVNFLLTDKTGTLTKNVIAVQDIYAYDGFTHNDVIQYAALLANFESDNPIDLALSQKAKDIHLHLPHVKKINFIPADSERKRSTLTVFLNKKRITISVGAPQIIKSFCKFTKKDREKFDREVEVLAKNGYRTLAVAVVPEAKEKHMKMAGMVALSDTLREDASQVISFLKENGIGVAMVTGDNRAIALQIAQKLSLGNQKIITKDVLDKMHKEDLNAKFFRSTDAFAEILPEDKLHLVERAKDFFVVSANGDGVNDLPAVKAANVGMAVKNAVSVLKSTADIVLLSEGISVIRDAIIEGRKIFERLYTYSLYRISESLRLIVTIAVLGIFYGVYPLTALQLILVALLNDIPIISLASDKVSIAKRPAKIDAKKRFTLSSLYGLVGVANSLILFFIIVNLLHYPWTVVQTMYFLKLTVSGHMLIYVAHTEKKWWKFFPSKQVVWATTITQLFASFLAFSGFLMPGHLSFFQIIFVWIWSFGWMQIAEILKIIRVKSANHSTDLMMQ